MSSRSAGMVAGASGGGCFIATLIFNLTLGSWTFSYCLWVLFGKQAPILADIICGAILGEITVPLGTVLWILSVFGVHFAH